MFAAGVTNADDWRRRGRPREAVGGRNNYGMLVSIPYERPRPNYMLVDTGPIFISFVDAPW